MVSVIAGTTARLQTTARRDVLVIDVFPKDSPRTRLSLRSANRLKVEHP